MEAIISRCGFRCDLCLAYRPNLERNPGNQQKVSDGWFKYFGFRLKPEDIYCEGCMTDNPKLIDNNCPVRLCVIEKELHNCSECDHYICGSLEERLVEYDKVKNKYGSDISDDDYHNFIKPYENKIRLDAFRD